MDKMKWCLKQGKGIKLVDPNQRISAEYFRESSEDLEMVGRSNKKWKVISSYYACYNALYSILIRCGIKCEIHDCSIELMKFLDFMYNEQEFLERLKEERINVQYYLKDPALKIIESDIISFINKCKKVLLRLNDNKIKEIREKLKEVLNEK